MTLVTVFSSLPVDSLCQENLTVTQELIYVNFGFLISTKLYHTLFGKPDFKLFPVELHL